MLSLYLITIIFSTIQFPSSNIYANKGYGDWNCYVEFHNGADFSITENEFAQVPRPSVSNYLRRWGATTPAKTDCMVMLSTDMNAANGWTLEHLDYSLKPNEIEIENYIYTDTVATCSPQLSPLVRHVHLAWLLGCLAKLSLHHILLLV